MPIEDIAAGIRTTLQTNSFSGSLKFDCGDQGVIVLANGTASTTDQPTDCTIAISESNLKKLLAGDLNPMVAMGMGKMKLSGDMGVAMGMARLLG